MANQSAIEKRLEFFSRTRRKFKSLSFSARKRTSKYTCAAGLNRLRKTAQEQIPRGKERSSFGSPACPMTLIVGDLNGAVELRSTGTAEAGCPYVITKLLLRPIHDPPTHNCRHHLPRELPSTKGRVARFGSRLLRFKCPALFRIEDGHIGVAAADERAASAQVNHAGRSGAK